MFICRGNNKVGMAETARRAAVQDGQDMAKVVIYAEVKLGELLKAIPKKKAASGGGSRSLPKGITHKTSHKAQTIADNPEIVQAAIDAAIKADTLPTTAQVYKLAKKKEALAKVESIRSKRAENPDGKYDVIVIDPPWPMEKIERDCRPNQHALDYPTMTEDGLKALKIPAADDCHIFLWTTQKFLPMAFRLIDAWAFRYVCTFVWHKPGGFQPIGLPQYNCEFALYARKGSPKFTDTKAFNVCFSAPRGAHSEKPGEFYAMVCGATYGTRLDMFSRRMIEGYRAWGNETE